MSSYRTNYNGAREPYGYSPRNHDVYRPSESQFIAPRDNYGYRRPPHDHGYHRPALYSYNHYPERGSRNLNDSSYHERDRVWHRADAELHRSPYTFQGWYQSHMNTVTDSHVTPMSPFSPGIRYRPKRQAYDRNSPALRHLQNSLMQPFQRLLEGPVEIAASRTPPAESQPRFIQSTPKVSSSRNELLAAGASSAKVIEGYQPTAMSVDDVFASEIAAQRKTRADRQKVVEAEKWERLREQRAAKMEALTKQEAERTKRIAEREAELEVQRLAKSNAEMEVQQPMDDEKAKTEKQIIVKQVSKETNQHRREKYNLAVQRGKTNKRLRAKQEAERQRNMRAQEKSLEQIYAEHNIDVIKIGTRSGGAMYAPWDSTLGDILDEQKREELDRKGIYFWLEAGTAVSVPPERESLETIEDVNMSG